MKLLVNIFISFLCVAAFLPAETTAQISIEKEPHAKPVKIPVYQGPGTYMGIAGYFPPGFEPEFTGRSQTDWLEIYYNKKKLWIHTAFIDPATHKTIRKRKLPPKEDPPEIYINVRSNTYRTRSRVRWKGASGSSSGKNHIWMKIKLMNMESEKLSFSVLWGYLIKSRLTGRILTLQGGSKNIKLYPGDFTKFSVRSEPFSSHHYAVEGWYVQARKGKNLLAEKTSWGSGKFH